MTGSNQVSLTVPAGGLSADTRVLLTPTAITGTAPAGWKAVPDSGLTVSGEGGAKLSNGTLTLPFSASAVAALTLRPQADVNGMRLFQLIQGVWQQATGTPTLNLSAGLYSQLIQAFGTYALFVPAAPAGPTLSSIALTCTATTLNVGAATTCAAEGRDSTGTPLATQPTFTFQSSASSVATVDAAGKVNGVAAGTTNITASSGAVTSNDVTVTVKAASTSGSIQVITTDVVFVAATSPSGVVFYQGLTGTKLVKDGVTRTLPDIPGYEFTSGYSSYDRPCVDDDGNVSYRAQQTAAPRAYQNYHYTYASNTYSPVLSVAPLDYIVDCEAGKVLSSNTSTDNGEVLASFWTAGQSTYTALPKVTIPVYFGSAAVDFMGDKVLYTTGVLQGDTYTAHNVTSPSIRLWHLLKDGTAVGSNSGTLYSWTPGQTPTTIELPNHGYVRWDLELSRVNDAGDLLVFIRDGYSPSINSYWVRVAGTWKKLDLGSTYYPITNTNVRGFTADGRVLIDVRRTADFKSELILYTP